jgi:serine protease Do
LIKFGETKRGWLGVRIQQVTKEIAEVQQLKEPNGALIAGVSEGSPAEKSGIKPGDIILEFDGKKIKTMRNLPKIVANTEVGKNVNVKIWRNKKLISKQLVLGRLESSKEFLAENKKIKKPKYVEIEKLKISIRDLTSDDIDQRGLDKNLKGVVVTEISSRSPLSFLLTSGDIIVELQSQAIKNTKDLEKVSKNISKSSEKTLLIRFINKRNQPSYGTVKIK